MNDPATKISIQIGKKWIEIQRRIRAYPIFERFSQERKLLNEYYEYAEKKTQELKKL